MKKFVFAILFALAGLAHAALSDAQLTVLAADINADPVLTANAQAGNYEPIAAAYNAATTYVVWKSSVTEKAILQSAAFDWTRVDNLTVGKARIWEFMFRFGSADPSQANVRAGIDAVWVGTAGDLAVRAAVYTQCKRTATRAEKLFAVGTGTDASPSVMAFEGAVTWPEVRKALVGF